MRKLLSVVVIFILISLFYNQNNSDEILVFNEINSSEHECFMVDGVNTNNFVSLYNKFNIESIYPRVNPIYKDIIDVNGYRFSFGDIEWNINRFKDIYLSLINKFGFLNEYNKLLINGIDIEKVCILKNV